MCVLGGEGGIHLSNHFPNIQGKLRQKKTLTSVNNRGLHHSGNQDQSNRLRYSA